MRPNDSSARPSRRPAAVRPRPRRRSAQQPLDQPIERAGRHDRVAVQEQQQIAARSRGCRRCWRRRTRRCAPSGSRARRGSARAASALPSVDALSTTMISCGERGRRLLQRQQARLQIRARVEADDDDRQHASPAARSLRSPRSVLRPRRCPTSSAPGRRRAPPASARALAGSSSSVADRAASRRRTSPSRGTYHAASP